MKIRKPAYFDDFRCLASSCPDSCCKEWDVDVDESAAALYTSLPSPLGDRLRQVLRVNEDGTGSMEIINGRCPMWQEDGLCRIQVELGHDALCKTCREFPRLTHDYGDFIEMGLELSCPEAARIILSSPVLPPVTQEYPGGEAPEYDAQAMEVLLRTRERMLQILFDPACSVPEALALGLLYGYRVQDVLDGGEEAPFDPASELAFARSIARPGGGQALVDFYAGLNILTPRWRDRLAAPRPGSWDGRLRHLARYGVERYWLQAVSDFDLVGRVKLVIASCLLVRQLGGELLTTAQLYAKEIENDADNVWAILDGAYASPALTDDRLLGLLLAETGFGN